jgi:ESS family glutamate:Na+ symporter
VTDPELGLATWAVNLALAGMAVALGWGLLQLLRWGASQQGGGLSAILDAMPAFPLALAGSLLVRLGLDRSGHGRWASARLQSRLGTVAADLLITAATASLDLTLLEQDWLPLTLLAAIGLGWNVLVLLLLAPRVLSAGWFERGITEFGQATGVVASGLLLLRMADPQDRSDALTAFSIKQMLLQPLLAGGLITVLAPMAVSSWGLERWTVLCLVLVVLWVGLGLVVGRSPDAT